MRALSVLGMLVCGMLVCGNVALAQSSAFDEARRHFEAAEFEAAIVAYDRLADGDALTGPRLSLQELLTLLQERAIAHHALAHRRRAERDLRALLSLDPAAVLGDSAPPRLRRRLDALRTSHPRPLSLTATALPSTERWAVSVDVSGDAGRLLRRIVVRVDRGTEYAAFEAEGGHVSLPPSSSLRFFVEAYGPAGVVIARYGSASDAIVVDGLNAERDSPPFDPPSESRRALWIGLVLGGIALIALVIGIAVGVSAEDQTRPLPPVEM